jgi:hypothetical protein
MEDTIFENYVDSYNDDEIYTDELVVYNNVHTFISDITFNKLILPDTVKVLDLWGENFDCIELTIPNNIEHIILRNINITNIHFLNLFVSRYDFSNIRVQDVDLNILINRLYNKYFNKNPSTERNDKYLNNVISSKYHHTIIEEILEYEKRTTQGNAFCKIIKEELVASAFHPDRVGPLILKYGIEILEIL